MDQVFGACPQGEPVDVTISLDLSLGMAKAISECLSHACARVTNLDILHQKIAQAELLHRKISDAKNDIAVAQYFMSLPWIPSTDFN